MPVEGNTCPDCEEDDTVGHKMTLFTTATAAELAAVQPPNGRGMRDIVGPRAVAIEAAWKEYGAGVCERAAPVISPEDGSVYIGAVFTPAELLCETPRVEPIPVTLPE